MLIYRHKILKPKFRYGILLICLIESAILYFINQTYFWMVFLIMILLSLIIVALKIFLLTDNLNNRLNTTKGVKNEYTPFF
ncbi:hypothetical protein fragment 2 [Helicobacter acinonychis str. Sheeba]|uniref:Uncharacterized protein n=1 Tax=Helicobacter acinonychis (strain Sheeba) TaxID=382638 RepID=Q17X76_HELAH|nr:hypothetical protein fragment 2 [Helicobacter acinonychis str. Sheeba]